MKKPKRHKLTKAERVASELRQRVAHDRSKQQSNAREKHLRALMGLPTRQEGRPQ